jgi:CBS domain-containing protein
VSLPEVGWCWLAFGSEGRIEQTLATDQDNGVVIADAVDSPAFRARLLACASRVNDTLDACGYPLCEGGIMARNPDRCQPLAVWRDRFSGWIEHPDEQALLGASICFDFRAIVGNEILAQTLRDDLVQRASRGRMFLYHMARNALATVPPLGLLREFSVDGDGKIDLKKNGARIITDAARVFALAQGVAATNTVQRLRLAGPAMNAPMQEFEAAVSAFGFLQTLRLRHQHRDDSAGRAGAAPLVAYHAEFDRQFLERAMRKTLGARTRWEGIDVAWLAPALLEGVAAQRSLDDWCAAYGISHRARHNAVSDALATAELRLILLAQAAGKGIRTAGELRACAEDARWLARRTPQ